MGCSGPLHNVVGEQKIEFGSPKYLRNVIRIVMETGLRIYKEMTPIENHQTTFKTVWP